MTLSTAKRKAPQSPALAAAKKRPKPVRPAPTPGPVPPPPPLPAAAEAPTWTGKRVKLRHLVPWPRNPRKINPAQSARLLNSFEEFGQVELVAVGPLGQVYNGHQRLKVLSERFGMDHEIEVRVASRELTELEREKLTIYLHKGATGDFDLEVLLKEFDPVKLDEWGLPDLNIPDVAENEWKGMPEFDGTPRSFARCAVLFETPEAVAAFAKLLGQDVTPETVSIWYPPKGRVDQSTEQWGEK